MQKIRIKADKIILDVWNQIEGSFSEYPMEEMQEKASNYGIVYYLRRKERQAQEKTKAK